MVGTPEENRDNIAEYITCVLMSKYDDDDDDLQREAHCPQAGAHQRVAAARRDPRARDGDRDPRDVPEPPWLPELPG